MRARLCARGYAHAAIARLFIPSKKKKPAWQCTERANRKDRVNTTPREGDGQGAATRALVIQYTVFADVKAATAERREATWPELVQILKEPARFRGKEWCPLLSGTTFGTKRSAKGSLRHTGNTEEVFFVEGDYDEEKISPEEAAALLTKASIAAVIYTSPSHHVGRPRWRVLAPLSRAVAPADRGRFVALLNGALGGILSPESFTLSQAFYFGQVDGREYAVIEVPGTPIDMHDLFLTERYPAGSGQTVATQSDGLDLPETLSDETMADLKSAVQALHPDRAESYLLWVQVLQHLKHAEYCGRPEAEALARDFSARSPKFDESYFSHKWAHDLHPSHGHYKTLFDLAQADGWVNPRRQTLETFGDVTNGRRFAKRYTGQFLYAHSPGVWFRWNERRWEQVAPGAMLAAARLVAEDALGEALERCKADDSKANAQNLKEALAVHRRVHRLEGMLKMAASEGGMSVPSVAAFDTDPYLLGVRNGVVDLRTGTLLTAAPSMLISKQACANFDRSATCPRFLQFLGEVFEGDAERISYMRRAWGYTLSGLVTEEVLFFAYGRGANGKSVLVNVHLGAMGDYGVTVRAEVLSARKNGNEAAREVPRMVGARMVALNEVSRDDVFDDQRLKELVSRERISARALYGNGFDFMPTHKLWLRGNHRPGVRDAGDGFWRRVHLIGFERQFKESEQRRDLEALLLEERDGILMWAIEGFQEWQRQGLNPPASIRKVTDQYRVETDLVGHWIAECCEMTPEGRTAMSDLYTSFADYAKREGMHPGSSIALGRDLESRGFRSAVVSRARARVGLRLRPHPGWGATDATDGAHF